jgi:hypothetical protein
VGEITSEIEQEIRDTRADLGRNLDELEGRARELADWRTHYRGHTPVFLGAAFVAGLWVGLKTVPRSSNGSMSRGFDNSHDPYASRHVSTYPEQPAGTSSRRAWTSGDGTTARALRQARQTWGMITDALLQTASAKAIQLVSDLVPDVRNHLNRRDRVVNE